MKRNQDRNDDTPRQPPPSKPDVPSNAGNEADNSRVLHELQVHQLELERQNEELRQTRDALERALHRYTDFYDFSPVGFFTLESSGVICEVNLPGCGLLQIARADLIGRRLGAFITPSDRPGFDDALARVFSAQGKKISRVKWQRADGQQRHIRMELIAAEGEPICRVVIVDITEQWQSELALTQERRFLQQIINASPSLIYVKDRQGRFMLGNPALARAYGTDVAHLLGRTDADFNPHPEQVATFRRHDREVMDTRVGGQSVDEVLTFADGSVHFLATDKVPLIDPLGACDQVLGVSTDITERKQAEIALHKADRLKNEFLAMLGHELRNPLVPLRNAAHVLNQLGIPDPRIHWAHRLIAQQVTHLTRMVDDLLDVSRILETKIQLKRTRIELSAVVAHALETAALMTESKNQTLVVSLPQVPIWLDADMMRLTQVLVNLLRNAAKYTPHGGHIKVMARVVEHEVEVRVQDNGMGMSAELLGCVFDLFSQDERTLDRAQGGLGIGLALVRKVVELHEGRVEAHSAGPGLGSEFTVWLPLASSPEEGLPLPNATAVPAVPVRVLIVDDDPMVLDSTAVVLQLDGHEVCTAANGEEALRVAPTFRPQLVLLDIGLGGMDGYQVAERLRDLPNGNTLMLVALSGYGLEEDRQRSIAAGFDRHLVKPVEPAVLASLFDALKNA